MKYTASYFKEGLPVWKRKKDPLLVRFLFRPISFYVSSICANMGITANDVSVFSTIVAIAACICFVFENRMINLVGAVLILFWLLLDCTDGNLARSIGHQPFGDFVDALSSYTLVAFLGISLGCYVYNNGGFLTEKSNLSFVVLGAVASVSDTLMRLTYQKFNSNRIELQKKDIIPSEDDKRTNHTQVNSLAVKIEMELGIASLLPVLIILGIVFESMDLVIFYMLLYYGGSACTMISKYVYKAMKYKNIKMD